jgi:hypothetical protein
MTGLIIAIIIFNVIAFRTNKRITKNQVIHIWTVSIALQSLFDLFIDNKFHGYWYFSNNIDGWWKEIPVLTILIPPVNIMFLNWYPFERRFYKRVVYIFFWLIVILIYEYLTLLPEPWGYFNYGWWTLWHSAAIDPILLIFILKYYKWICKMEKL